MQNLTYKIIAVIVGLLVVVGALVFASREPVQNIPTEPIITATSTPATPTEIRFKGTITAYSTACFSDGICSVTVDGKEVIITAGFRQQKTVGTLIGVDSIADLENQIGARAEVYAALTEEGSYTLYGSQAYFVKVTPKSVSPQPTTECFVGGCSSEVCSDRAGVVSTCIYKPEFACYKNATCKRQSDNKCGWSQTTELKKCVAAAR